jgi:UDP-hydrolysing UDP-N-acetyl-D-glucosamine 2-epimerase
LRKICFVTGSRADYGLLYPLIKMVAADPDLELQIVATGAHLEEGFGSTVTQIEDDGFKIDADIPLAIAGDTPVDIAAAMARALSGAAECFDRLLPDIAVLLGDRYEIMAVAQAALVARIPVAHIHGGEITEGAIDDSMRHAITKITSLHFTATEPYRRRVIQMGEHPDRVFNVGAIGLDNLDLLDLSDRSVLSAAIGFPVDGEFFLVTYHPETLGDIEPADALEEMLAALDEFADHRLIVTGVNADPGHSAISARLDEFARTNPDRVLLKQSLGQLNYLSAMSHCAAVIGNSSSGIIEAPAFSVPTVNIGDRQKGRLRATSIVDCGPARADISAAVEKSLTPEFRDTLKGMVSPYGTGGASERILPVLKSADLVQLGKKAFHDLETGCAG